MDDNRIEYTQEQKERFAVEDAVRAQGEQIENTVQGPTLEQMRAALKDDSTPLAVKRIIRMHLFGHLDGRREISHELRHSAGYKFTLVKSGARLKANKIAKPAGMSGRQFKRLRKSAFRELRGSRSDAEVTQRFKDHPEEAESARQEIQATISPVSMTVDEAWSELERTKI